MVFIVMQTKYMYKLKLIINQNTMEVGHIYVLLQFRVYFLHNDLTQNLNDMFILVPAFQILNFESHVLQ